MYLYYLCTLVKSCFAIKFNLIRYRCTLYAPMILKLIIYAYVVLEQKQFTCQDSLYIIRQFVLYIKLCSSLSPIRLYHIALYTSKIFSQISSIYPLLILPHHSTHFKVCKKYILMNRFTYMKLLFYRKIYGFPIYYLSLFRNQRFFYRVCNLFQFQLLISHLPK